MAEKKLSRKERRQKKNDIKEKEKEQREKLKEEGFETKRTGGLWSKIAGQKMLVDKITGQAVQGRNPRLEVEERAREGFHGDYGTGESETKKTEAAPEKKEPEKQPGGPRGPRGIGGLEAEKLDPTAFNDFRAYLRDAIERGYARTEKGTPTSVWNLVTSKEFIDNINGHRIYTTPLEDYDVDYRNKMRKTRGELEEKLKEGDIKDLTGSELDIIITTMLKHEDETCRDFFYEYVLTVATATRKTGVGNFIGSLYHNLTNISTTIEGQDRQGIRGLISREMAQEYLGMKSNAIVDGAVDEFLGKLPPDLDDNAKYRYVNAFRQAILKDKSVIDSPELFVDLLPVEYNKDLNSVIDEVTEKLRPELMGELAESKANSLKEKIGKLKEKVEESKEIDSDTKADLKKHLESMESIVTSKAALSKKTYDTIEKLEEDEKGEKSKGQKERLNMLSFQKDADLEMEIIMLQEIKGRDPVVKAAKEVIERMKKTKTEDRITEDQWLIATIVYEGGQKSQLRRDDELEHIEDATGRLKKFYHAAVVQIAPPDEEEELLKMQRKELKKELGESWGDYNSRKPGMVQESDRKVLSEYLALQSKYLLDGARYLLESGEEAEVSENTKRRSGAFVRIAIDNATKLLEESEDYEKLIDEHKQKAYEEKVKEIGEEKVLEQYGDEEEAKEELGEKKVLKAMEDSILLKIDRYYKTKDRDERKQIEGQLKDMGIEFRRSWTDFEKSFGRLLKLLDNYLSAPWVSPKTLNKIENRISRLIAKTGAYTLHTAKAALNVAIALGLKLPKAWFWDINKKGKWYGLIFGAGLLREIYSNFRNWNEPIYKFNKKGELKYMTNRGRLGMVEAAVSATVMTTLVSLVSYWPLGDKNEFLKTWRNQMVNPARLVYPLRWRNIELGVPNFTANPFTHRGYTILNQQKVKNMAEGNETVMDYLATDPRDSSGKSFMNAKDDEKWGLERKKWMLQLLYPDVKRSNLEAKLVEHQGQLEWLQAHPAVTEFLAERKLGIKIGLKRYDDGKVVSKRSKGIIKGLENTGWIVLQDEAKRGEVTGKVFGRMGLLKGKNGEIPDGLKLNSNKTKEFVAELMKLEKQGEEVDLSVWDHKRHVRIRPYLEGNLKKWRDNDYLLPKIMMGYMETYGIKDTKTAELLIANPELAKWIAPMTQKGHAPEHIKEGSVERVVQILKEEIEKKMKELGIGGVIPALPKDKKADVSKAVLTRAWEEKLLEDTSREYAQYKAMERIKKELGRLYPASAELQKYLLENEVRDEWFDYLKEGRSLADLKDEKIALAALLGEATKEEKKAELKEMLGKLKLEEKKAKTTVDELTEYLGRHKDMLEKLRENAKSEEAKSHLDSQIDMLEGWISYLKGELVVGVGEGSQFVMTEETEKEIKETLTKYLQKMKKERDVKSLLAAYNMGSATVGIVPGRLDEYVAVIIEQIEKGGSANDFNPVDGILLEWADAKEGEGYLRSIGKEAQEMVKNISEDTKEASANLLAVVDTILKVFAEDNNQKYLEAVGKCGEARIRFVAHTSLLCYIEMARKGDKVAKDDLKGFGITINEENRPVDEDVEAIQRYLLKDVVEEINKKGIDPVVEELNEKAKAAANVKKEETGEVVTPEGMMPIKGAGLANENEVGLFEDADGNYWAVFSKEPEKTYYTLLPIDAKDALKKKGSPYEKIYEDEVKLMIKDGEAVYKIKARNDGGYIGRAYDAFVYVDKKGKIISEEKIAD